MKAIISFLLVEVICLNVFFVEVAKADSAIVSGRFSPVSLAQNRNTISGFVFDESRRPLEQVYVELQNDMYSTLSRTRTNGAGFFTFRGIPNGTFRVKILPYGSDYEEQSRDVSLISVSPIPGRGATSEQVDFYLKIRKNVGGGPLAAPGVVFAQNVPENAQKLYQEGVAFLREKKEKEGFDKLKNALETFPDYFLALDRLGTEYVVRGFNRPAIVLLSKAVEINPRSFSSTFGLGLAHYRLQDISSSVELLRRAVSLYNESASAHLWLGIALLQSGKPADAETALLKANKLSKGESPEVHWQLARLFSEQKRYREAADELELFLKFQTDVADAEKIKQTIAQLRQKANSK